MATQSAVSAACPVLQHGMLVSAATAAAAPVAVANGTTFEGHYTLTGSSLDTSIVQDVLEEMPAIIHSALGLPDSYAEGNIRVFLAGGSRRHLLAASLTVGFVLLPAPTLPPMAQLTTRLNDPQTTLGVASALAVTLPAIGPVVNIGRSDEAGVIQEPPRPVQREQQHGWASVIRYLHVGCVHHAHAHAVLPGCYAQLTAPSAWPPRALPTLHATQASWLVAVSRPSSGCWRAQHGQRRSLPGSMVARAAQAQVSRLCIMSLPPPVPARVLAEQRSSLSSSY